MRTFFIFLGAVFLSIGTFAAGNQISVEIRLDGKPVIQTADISEARAVNESPAKKWGIIIKMKPEAQARFKETTQKNIGKKMDIVLNGKILSSPEIKAQIDSGTAQVGNLFTKKQAEDIVSKITEANKVK